MSARPAAPIRTPAPLTVAGVMSGTSADGVDVAICRIGGGSGEPGLPRVRFLGLSSRPYPRAVREAVLHAMEGGKLSAPELSRLNWRLGEIYADCVAAAAQEFGVKVSLVGIHGQTIHHETTPTQVLGARIRSTWQIGEAAAVAERMRCAVISDFRPADLAAGGQGAPLVPMLDWCLFRSARVSRVLQNLGGIGNLTAIPAGAGADAILAFDTGPANMVIDFCMSSLFGRKFDRDGAVARRGTVLRAVIDPILRDPYFHAAPPKSCGREQFGSAFGERFVKAGRKAGGSNADIVATATALTTQTVIHAYRHFVTAHLARSAPAHPVEFCVAGGGAKNRTVLSLLNEGLGPLGVTVRPMEDLGIPAQAKEAVAFALLAWLTWNHLPGNVPSATGALRPLVLGKISYA